MLNKKAQGISMTYIVIAALALIVLIVIVLFFTGGMEKIFEKITKTAGGEGEEQVIKISQCRSFCTMDNKDAWDNLKCGDVITGYVWKDGKCTPPK